MFQITSLWNHFLWILTWFLFSCSMATWHLMLSQSQSQRWTTNQLRSSWLIVLTICFSTPAKMVGSCHFLEQCTLFHRLTWLYSDFAYFFPETRMIQMFLQFCLSFMRLGVVTAGSWPLSWRKLQYLCKTMKMWSLQRWYTIYSVWFSALFCTILV